MTSSFGDGEASLNLYLAIHQANKLLLYIFPPDDRKRYDAHGKSSYAITMGFRTNAFFAQE